MISFQSVCQEAARAAGTVLLEKLGSVHVREKNKADLVTEADELSQETIARIIRRSFPDHFFLGEENPELLGKPEFLSPDSYCWIVDPLDGTTNFVHSVPFFAVSIALAKGEDLLCGVIYNPVTEEFFSVEKGQGAFLNGQRIQVSKTTDPGQSLVAVGFPTDTRSDSPDLLAFLRAVPIAQAIRRTGSTALNLAYVAAGRYDAMWGFSTNSWDVAAAVLLLQEAGGIIEAPDGSPFSLRNPSFIAAANRPLLRNWNRILWEMFD